MNPLQSSKPGSTSPVVSKFSPKGTLVFSSYLGGTDNKIKGVAGGVVVNSQEKLVLAATTWADDFNITDINTVLSGGSDIILTIINQSTDSDSDGDGVVETAGLFPQDPFEWRDSDGDLLQGCK